MIYHNGKLTQAYQHDAGWDLYSTQRTEMKPMTTYYIPTGVHLELPKGVFAEVVGRSGLSGKGFKVDKGTIDGGYRGELMVICWSFSEFIVEEGMKIAQLIFHEKVPHKVAYKYIIGQYTERGKRGFGSSDAK